MTEIGPFGTQATILLFLLLPGFVFMWTFERMAGPVGVRGTDRLLRAVAWSAFIDALGSYWLYRIGVRIAHGKIISPFELWIASIVLVLVGPLVIGLLIGLGKRHGWFQAILSRVAWLSPLDSTPTSWDFALSQDEPRFVRIRLKDGSRIGGFYGSNSYASWYPEKQDLFLEEAWLLDEQGNFVDPVDGTLGLLIQHDAVEAIEFLEVR